MKALILAAGLGSRLNLEIPKPMYEIKGKPVLEHNILLLKKHGIKDLWINVHFKPEKVKDHFGNGSNFQTNINYSFEEILLGTSGALKNIPAFENEDRFLVVYGDNLTNIDLTKMINFHKNKKALATVALFNPSKTPHSGIAGGKVNLDEEGKIISFEEGKDGNFDYLVNAGVYVFEREILDYIPANTFSDFGKDIFPKLLQQGNKILGYITESYVFAIDTEEALSNTNKFFDL